MKRIDPNEKPSWVRECGCGACWRFYEDDIEVVFPEDQTDLTTLFIICEDCGRKVEVTFFVKPYSAKFKIELAASRQRVKID